MKKYGTLIALAVAVVFGIIAVILANQWLTSRVPTEVVMHATDLAVMDCG